jgi:hypothetical protein
MASTCERKRERIKLLKRQIAYHRDTLIALQQHQAQLHQSAELLQDNMRKLELALQEQNYVEGV